MTFSGKVCLSRFPSPLASTTLLPLLSPPQSHPTSTYTGLTAFILSEFIYALDQGEPWLKKAMKTEGLVSLKQFVMLSQKSRMCPSPTSPASISWYFE